MDGDEFKTISGDLPFIADDEFRPRYSQFWVNADVLNIRSGPTLGSEIISETYFGSYVFAYAKTGEWVAISKAMIAEEFGINTPARWVNMKYLSAKHIKEQVNTSVLKNKCSFKAYEAYLRKLRGGRSLQKLARRQNIYLPCGAVNVYISQQHLKSRPHDYIHEYETRRQSHSNPDKYSAPFCYRLN